MSSTLHLLLLFQLLFHLAGGIYCHVGYGQISKDSRLVHLFSKSVWVRNCPGKSFCFGASPAIQESAEALSDIVGGDWNDKLWGQGGFVRGCQDDFGFHEGRRGDVVTLKRATGMWNETGVHVIDEFEGSGKEWEFKIHLMCNTNLCSGAWGRLQSLASPLPAIYLSTAVSLWLIARS